VYTRHGLVGGHTVNPAATNLYTREPYEMTTHSLPKASYTMLLPMRLHPTHMVPFSINIHASVMGRFRPGVGLGLDH